MFVVLPDNEFPRVILPLHSRQAFINGFKIHNTASLLNRLLRKISRYGYYVFPFWTSHLVYPTSRFRILLSEIQNYLNIPALGSVALYVGTAGSANQKITIQVMDADFQPMGVIKIAWQSTAANFLKNELNALTYLSQFNFKKLDFPKNSHLFQVQKLTCLYQNDIFQNATSCDLTLSEPVYQAALELAKNTRSYDKIPDLLQQTYQLFKTFPLSSQLQSSLFKALEIVDFHTVSSVVVHGDFVPYNIKIKRGQALLIDWEFFSPTGFPLYDLMTFVYQGGIYVLRRSPEKILKKILDGKSKIHRYFITYLRELQIPPTLLKPLLLIYMATALSHLLRLRSDVDINQNHFIAGMRYLIEHEAH